MEIEIKLEVDNTEEVLRALKEQVDLGLEAIGAQAQSYAMRDCPVDTGLLRNSIAFAVADEHAVYIGTNVEYAPYVEYNDKAQHSSGKAHFLRDAATTHSAKYKAIMKAALQGTSN